jgi:phosphate/sulfate permease
MRKSLANMSVIEFHQYESEERRKRIDKMFEIPLIVSIMMLAMAHGSNEINVSAPLLSEIFFLDSQTETVSDVLVYFSIGIGLLSVSLGSITLGKRYLYKFRHNFMKTTLTNGFIANTCVSIVLFFSSMLNFTVSCTYILMPCLLLLYKLDKGKSIDIYKAIQAVLIACTITFGSALLSVVCTWGLLYLDYSGPGAEFNNLF